MSACFCIVSQRIIYVHFLFFFSMHVPSKIVLKFNTHTCTHRESHTHNALTHKYVIHNYKDCLPGFRTCVVTKSQFTCTCCCIYHLIFISVCVCVRMCVPFKTVFDHFKIKIPFFPFCIQITVLLLLNEEKKYARTENATNAASHAISPIFSTEINHCQSIYSTILNTIHRIK